MKNNLGCNCKMNACAGRWMNLSTNFVLFLSLFFKFMLKNVLIDNIFYMFHLYTRQNNLNILNHHTKKIPKFKSYEWRVFTTKVRLKLFLFLKMDDHQSYTPLEQLQLSMSNHLNSISQPDVDTVLLKFSIKINYVL